MAQIINKYKGNLVPTSHVFGTATHNLILRSTVYKTRQGFPVVRVEYKVSTYRLEGGDQHPSLYSTDADKHVSSFQSANIAEFAIVTSTKTNYLETLTDSSLTSSILTEIFRRPDNQLVIRNDGTTAPTELAPILASLQAIAIDPETLDDTVDL
jgi:hypothetical protein